MNIDDFIASKLREVPPAESPFDEDQDSRFSQAEARQEPQRFREPVRGTYGADLGALMGGCIAAGGILILFAVLVIKILF